MSFYTIKDLETLSTIKAHTLRIWEQRYDVFQPERSEGNVRRYTDRDLKKLLNIASLINHGYKISKIVKMSDEQVNQLLDELMSGEGETSVIASSLVNKMIEAGLTYNEEELNKAYSLAIAQFGLKDAYVEVLYPLLNKLGLMWSKDEMMPAQEHFVSNFIKQKLFAAIDQIRLHTVASNKNKWLLFLPEEEGHEIGLLMAQYILKSKGIPVVYLGQSVPYENLQLVIDSVKPSDLYFFAVKHNYEGFYQDYVKRLVSDYKKLKIHASGYGVLNASQKNNIHIINTIDDLVKV